MSGLSWFGVEVIASVPSDVLTNHTRHEPKRDKAACVNCSLKESTEPKASLSFFSKAGEIVVLQTGASSFQKNE